MARVIIKEEGSTAGIWVTCEHGQVALVADENQGAYLCLYGKPEGTIPALAISVRDGGPAVIQLPDGISASVIPLNKLFDVIKMSSA